jgi:hypothetical protein
MDFPVTFAMKRAFLQKLATGLKKLRISVRPSRPSPGCAWFLLSVPINSGAGKLPDKTDAPDTVCFVLNP